MKTLWNSRSGSSRSGLRRAAQVSAIALLGLVTGGCGIAEMFDPTPPISYSRPPARWNGQYNSLAVKPPRVVTTPTTRPIESAIDEDVVFGPSTAVRHSPPGTSAPDPMTSGQGMAEIERPKGQVVVIGRRPTEPSVPSVSAPLTPPPGATAGNVTPSNVSNGTSTPPVQPVIPEPVVPEQAVASAQANNGSQLPIDGQSQVHVLPKPDNSIPPTPTTHDKPLTEIGSTANGSSAEPTPPIANAGATNEKPAEPVAPPRPISPEQARLRARVAELKAQLKSGVEVDERDERGRTLLQQAAIAGELEVAETLLDAGASIKAQDSQGWTALHWAASSGHPEICELLIASGAAIDARGWLGDSPLQWAATFDRRDVAELLLARGADVNAADKRGRTALHAAIESDAISTVQVLLAHGADLGARDGAGLTPLHQAVFTCRKAIEDADADGAVDVGDATQASARLAADHQQARQRAIEHGCNMVKLLISKGAQVNAASDRGVTPLHLAAWDDMSDVASLLLAAGANPAAKDQQDRTPVEYAKQRHQQGMMKSLTAALRAAR